MVDATILPGGPATRPGTGSGACRRLAIAAVAAAAVAPAARGAGGDWIDALPGVWNAAEAPIPPAPAGDVEALARCAEQVRPASSAADRALEAAGWKLFGPVLVYGETSLVRALSGVDGMCRPLAFQAFAFAGDRFAGTLAPAPMDSRSDGVLVEIPWLDPVSVVARFARYDADDALCCPTRESVVTYEIERGPAGAILVALSAETTALEVAEEEEAPAAAPPPLWTGKVGLGLSLTEGNSDASSYNLSFSAVRNPHARYVFRTEGLYLRSEQDGRDTGEKTTLLVRGERAFSDRLFTFAEAGYLRDPFKEIDYLVSPLVGAGWNVLLAEPVSLVVDAGLGGAFERDLGGASTSDAAFKLGESLVWTISPRAELTQSATALWRLEDPEDAYYHAEIGVAASVTARSELKLSYLVDYDSQPPAPDLEKTDTALLVTVAMRW